MKTIYRANSTTKQFASSDIVDDDYVLQANETFEDPSGKQEPAKLVGTSWQDATQEEHEAWVKSQQAAFQLNAGPSQADKAMNTLGLQIAKITAENTALKQTVNTLGLQVAQLTKKENGGN